MKLYPNPATDKLTVELSGVNMDAATLKIYGITGVAVHISELTQLKTVVDLSNLDQGIYLISVETGDHTLLKRIQVLK